MADPNGQNTQEQSAHLVKLCLETTPVVVLSYLDMDVVIQNWKYSNSYFNNHKASFSSALV